jgi:hypothetical protein
VTPIVELEGVDYRYDTVRVLERITLTVAPGWGTCRRAW